MAAHAAAEHHGPPVAHQSSRVTSTVLGMLLFIAFRFEWTYGAAAVIAVFPTVLVTLGGVFVSALTMKALERS